MSVLARLGVVLGINTSEFIAGLKVADEKSKAFKQNLRETRQTVDSLKTGLALTGAAMLAFGVSAASAADEISDLADANDTTIGSIIELQHALEASGGEAGNAGKLLSSFTNAIDGAAQGSDKLRDSFKAAGVSVRDLATLSGDELRSKTLAGLSKIDDVVRRNALAMDLFGKAAKGVDFTNLGSEVDRLNGKYDAQAKAVADAAAAFQKIKLFISDMQIAAMQAMQPITQLIDKMPTENRIETMAKWFKYLGEVMAFAFGVMAVRGVMKLAGALRTLAVTNPWLLALAAGGAVATHFGLAALEGDESNEPSPSSPTGGGGGRSIEQSSRDKMIAKYKAEMDEVVRLSNLKKGVLFDEFGNQKNLLDLESKKYAMTTAAYEQEKLFLEIGRNRYEVEQKYNKERLDALKQLELASSDEYNQAKALYDLKVIKIEELRNVEADYQLKIGNQRAINFEDELKRQQSWAAGWEEAMLRYQEASTKAADRGKAAFETVMNSMDSALRNFVETGKLNFKDLVGSIVKDLLYMQIKAQATGLFSSLAGNLSGMFSGFSGSAAAGMNASAGMSSIPMSFAASGGVIDSPTVVGENGAELFVPRTPGTIIPNGAWQSQMSSQPQTVINGNYIANLSAIDTQSGTQFLARNKDTIWAAYQSANRSVPISR